MAVSSHYLVKESSSLKIGKILKTEEGSSDKETLNVCTEYDSDMFGNGFATFGFQRRLFIMRNKI